MISIPCRGHPIHERHHQTVSRNQEAFADRYAGMATGDQALALARLANRLSLMARETYAVGGGVADADRLRTFNEAQAEALAQLERLMTADPERYPDDVFANILCDQFEMLGIDPQTLLATVGILRPRTSKAASRSQHH